MPKRVQPKNDYTDLWVRVSRGWLIALHKCCANVTSMKIQKWLQGDYTYKLKIWRLNFIIYSIRNRGYGINCRHLTFFFHASLICLDKMQSKIKWNELRNTTMLSCVKVEAFGNQLPKYNVTCNYCLSIYTIYFMLRYNLRYAFKIDINTAHIQRI